MVTKEEIKKVIDRLPDNILDEVYSILHSLVKERKKNKPKLTVRDFRGILDNVDIRNMANE